MGKYIDKDALVAEIERLKECNRKICAGDFDFLKKSYPEHYYSTEIYNDILSFIDTLEVKEVDNNTDAFIEKAADYIANNMQCNGYTLQTKAKFIRDFKNYMKGE